MKPFDRRPAGIVAAALMLTACVGQMAPTVAVMPGPNKPFDAFSADQTLCRQYADAQIAPLRDQANASTVGSRVDFLPWEHSSIILTVHGRNPRRHF